MMNDANEVSPAGPRDAELVAELRTDPASLEAFYRLHVGDVAAFVARRVGDAHAVADIVSNTFLAAINGAHTFDRDRSPVTARFWLLAIARNEVARYQGQAGRQVVWLREGSADQLSEDETARIDELIDAERLAPDIRAALDQLSPRVCETFLLVAVDGIPQEEAASMLGISHTALRARLARARRRLRHHLAALEGDSAPTPPRTVPAPAPAPTPAPEPPAADPPMPAFDAGADAGSDDRRSGDRTLSPSNLPGGSHGL
jgi:RNA polymerase sigma factor (sigma-70 family)